MNNDRQKILADYVSYLFTTRRTYDTIGKYIKYVTDFLESAEDINRRSYMAYKRENANIGARYPLMSEAICDLLHHLKIGYNRKDQKIKTLERLDAISEKNRRLLNDFIVWLTDSNDYYKHICGIAEARIGIVSIKECPTCFTKYYSHFSEAEYNLFLHSIERGENLHFKNVFVKQIREKGD